jgi:hypothetical protein
LLDDAGGKLKQPVDFVHGLLVPWKGDFLHMSPRHLRSWQGARRANTWRI